ncbi:hypothetical protein C0T31_10060 [Dysgonamonadaceae bacterium]|nr:hypothetical protein C0T31_10060 [Dysgonamonadaceae bacterium]
MKLRSILLFFAFSALVAQAQTLDDAKKNFGEGRYAEALPVFQSEYASSPENAQINHWLGVCLYETGKILQAEKYLAFAAKKNIPEAHFYLGQLFTLMYRFDDAEKEFALYEKAKRRDKEALAKLSEKRAFLEKLRKMVSRTEDVQIIDSVVVPKKVFLSAYHLSATSGSLLPMQDFFENAPINDFPVFLNERKDKVYFSLTDSLKNIDLYTMEKLLDHFGNQKRLPESINDAGDQAYPFVMSDGVTIYFASTGHNSIGGYDLYITRYNFASDSYLNPNQLNMPFNSPFNDYMLAVDEEKGVGWFASDRFQPEDSVCVYTFIPNREVTLLENPDEIFMANRARISSIRATWKEGVDYSSLIAEVKENNSTKVASPKKDFEFVIDDSRTYHQLSDFKNANARNLYVKAINLQKQLESVEKELSDKRDRYAQAGPAEKNNLAPSILALEKEAEALHRQIDDLFVQSRNTEIRNTF